MGNTKNIGINWGEIISHDISDEAAYVLLAFVTQIATCVEDRFYAQAIQHGEDYICPGIKELFKNAEDEEEQA